MSTQQKRSCAFEMTSPMSVVKWSRSRFFVEQLREARLVDRHLAAAERVDLLLEDVARVDLVAELGEAGRRDQPDPADPDYAYRLALAHGRGRLPAVQA